jgi:methyl-accepting chemotaxis protein
MFKSEKPENKSAVASAGTNDLNTKINLLAENVKSLLDRNQTIDEEIKSVKSNVQSMINQIHQINVSPTINHVFIKKSVTRKLKWNIHICELF